MGEGLLHLYTGSGKGKTTAAVGLAVRAAGTGCPVIFAQFLKDGPSGELVSLEALGIPILRSQERLGFTFLMNDEKRALCTSEQRLILAAVAKTLASIEGKKTDGCGPQRLVVLDEVLDALDLGFLDEDELRAFIDTLPVGTELVLTGRQAPAWLIDQAAYHTEFRKLKHPYDQGTPARKSIEF
ncbi:MAG: cob(I)yrinic acid a,c-diamide adenosyltransferase [Coriobacteriales bacterium]|jgi:cob(I)alamin adenosyltransferase|nr:cob(I)yrinic acid a,c-diamide adenosyltransferase [Coriobacteriales bacterium]